MEKEFIKAMIHILKNGLLFIETLIVIMLKKYLRKKQ